MGVQLDTLLTTGEETMNSTASEFIGEYNWVVEFDRAGTDVVFYQYDNQEWVKEWRRTFPVGQGSYSDIASMTMGVCAANVGIGYHNQHTNYCHANLDDTFSQLVKFAHLYERMANIKFPFDDYRWDSLEVYDREENWKDSFYDAWSEYADESLYVKKHGRKGKVRLLR
jgi:hypothetical protein